MLSCLTPYRLRACLVAISVTLCLGCQGLVKRDAVTGRGTINQFSEADEIRLGDSVLQSLQSQCRQQQIPFDAPGDHLELIQSIGSRLVDVSHRQNLPWEFHFVSSSDVNACAAPGGKVFVFAGLFGNLVTTPEELAAVLAHEAAHVTARHTAERMSRERFAPIVVKGRQL